MTAATLLPLAALPVLAFAAAHDVAVRRVPDWTSAALSVTGLATRAVTGDLLPALGAMLAVFLALFFMWQRGWLGGGDVKLLTASVTLVPVPTVPDLFLAIALCGGVLALAYLAARHLPKPGLPNPGLPAHPPPKPSASTLAARIYAAERWRMRRRAPLPYACAIAAGCTIAITGG